ncbi:MAG: M48 family metallopeptidase [Verrucomicrobiae bacterium]|nr:M48 family metallopeptidase [Verrucomicrobiae bacterium]
MVEGLGMEGRRKWVLAPLLVAGVIALIQYFGAERFVNPETGRAARVAISPEQESELGLQSYRQVLAQEDVVTSGPEVDLVTRVARRLAAVTGEAARQFDWQVSVVRSPQVNAFCLPGGKIVVYTGILPVAKTEAGLATVMGHEMAHATSRHGAQRIFQSQMANTLMQGAQMSVALGDMSVDQQRAILGAIGAGAKFGVILPFSRDHESEADAVGLMYMARAGYDPRESVEFWERMAAASQGGQPPEFASTHPAHETRIENLKAMMPRAVQEYEQATAGKAP